MNGGVQVEDYKEIYEKYFKDVYKYTYSLCCDKQMAEEITQETFFKALNSIKYFDHKCKLYVWLCQIAKHTYFAVYRKNKQFVANSGDDEPSFDMEIQFEKQETAKQLHKLLHSMEQPYKEVFTLRVFGELPFKQIGELFGKSESWARVTCHRAKIKLKEQMK